jgi:GT2 family glycosyltransferase
MNQHTVAIVILNWNGRQFLERFLPSLVKFKPDFADIIIADNDSKDDSIFFLNENYPTLRIIQNKENGGFAKGYNDALSQITADYYILLNSDIEVTENWIEPVIALMESDPKIAACQPKICSFLDPKRFEYAGAAGGFIDKYGYPFCRGRLFESVENDQGQYDDIKEIFWATGACMFVRASVYHEAGGLDNDFFAHMEEIDFRWRVKNMGYKVMYCGAAKVFHVGGGTLPKGSSKKTYLNFRNNFILLYKNLSIGKFLSIFFIRLLLDGAAAFKFLFDGGIKDFLAVGKAHFVFYFTCGKHRKKRKKISHLKVTGIFSGNTVYLHYIKKIKLFSQLNPEKFS